MEAPFFDDIELVILDFDGVIADSEVISLESLKQTLSDFGWELCLNDVYLKFLGRSSKYIYSQLNQHVDTKDTITFEASWNSALYQRFREQLTPVPLVNKLLDVLSKKRLEYCIASSSTFERIEIALDAINLNERFDHIFSSQLVERSKPWPDLFLHAAKELKIDVEKCLVIEDSHYGVQAAKAANMKTIGFTGGKHLKNIRKEHAVKLIDHGADMTIGTYQILIEQLSKN